MAVTSGSSAAEATAARLLNFSSKCGVALLDSTVDVFFGGSKSNEDVRGRRDRTSARRRLGAGQRTLCLNSQHSHAIRPRHTQAQRRGGGTREHRKEKE